MYRHGKFSNEAIASRAYVRELIRAARRLEAEILVGG
jgi:hypothetical protein